MNFKKTKYFLLLFFTFLLIHCKVPKKITHQPKRRDIISWEQMPYSADTSTLKNLFKPQLNHPWVDSVFNTLSEEEKIGQLFMVAAYSNRDEKFNLKIDSLIRDYKIGGLIFFQGGPVRQVKLTNRWQAISNVPLLISIDGEWGLGMRLDSTLSFPRQMTLGAINDNRKIFEMGKEIASQCKMLGIHVNFAPVADINSNPLNPVIGDRSFGESREEVFDKAYAYMEGLQQNGIIANGKHFPGHGDTGADSHVELPLLNHDVKRLDSLELFPFRKLINHGLMSMMVAHLHIPTMDSTAFSSTTLSENVVCELLKDKLRFQGLIFTDALNMKAVSKYFEPGKLEVKALQAGNDVLLYPENIPLAIKEICNAVADGTLLREDIDNSVRKILYFKYWCGLKRKQTIPDTNLFNNLNNATAKIFASQLYEDAQTLVRNEKDFLPVQSPETFRFASLSAGAPEGNLFQQTLTHYAPFSHFTLKKNDADIAYDSLKHMLDDFDVVVVGLHRIGKIQSRDFGMDKRLLSMLEELNQKTRVIIVLFGTPYALTLLENFHWLLLSYEDNDYTRQIAPQILFGAMGVKGTLPVTASPQFSYGTGIKTNSNLRLRVGYPEEVGMSSVCLNKIDSIANDAIKNKATPGAQVLVARKGLVVFEKCFGYTAYDSLEKVTPNTLYDIASVSKVAGTLQAIMYLKSEDKIDLNKPVSYYIPELKRTNKDTLKIVDILTHQSGLPAYLEYWKNTLDKKTGKISPVFYFPSGDTINSGISVSSSLKGIPSLPDSVWKWTINSPVTGKKEYVYSDIGFQIMKKAVENILYEPMENFLTRTFYNPLGLSTLGYNPLKKFPLDRMAPTEMDTVFRRELIRGTVHDPGAAMQGGIAGHAGLFSNIHDLAVLMQMNLQDGYYGGRRYFNKGIVKEFYSYKTPVSRRSLGWDKKEPKGNGPTSELASTNTFGHSGFTGTCVWVDPDKELVYIFLSNRVHPDVGNKKLITMDVRTKIMDVIYRSME